MGLLLRLVISRLQSSPLSFALKKCTPLPNQFRAGFACQYPGGQEVKRQRSFLIELPFPLQTQLYDVLELVSMADADL